MANDPSLQARVLILFQIIMAIFEPPTFYGYQQPDPWMSIIGYLRWINTLIKWVCQMKLKRFTRPKST
jgi:hypothetical protein